MIHSRLAEIFDADRLKTDTQSLQTFGKDWTLVYEANPAAVVFPTTIDEVKALVQLANEVGFALVPSGGRTGLSGGAVATNQEVVVAFDKMNKILDFNAVDRQVVCEPGVITGQLHQFATDHDLFYPVDFASSGSSQIGGNVATNAGGIKVIRYGLTRQWVLGLKVVTGQGELLDLNRGLIKNATGYDLRQLFIGSEGTLGLIVEVTLGLVSPPEDPTVLLLAVEDMNATMKVLEAFQQKMVLSAFEFFSEKALSHVLDDKNLQRPLETRAPYYVLVEFENNADSAIDQAMELFETCMESGWVTDGTISQNSEQVLSLWRLREDISETISRFTPYKNDISVKVSRIPEFLAQVDAFVAEKYPDFEIVWFGHIGDGNVHLNILKPSEMDTDLFFQRCSRVSEGVFALVKDYGGSVSAEHGVGLLKKPFLGFSRSPQEIAYMKAIKLVFDPNGVLNPGKIFDLGPEPDLPDSL
ncbi:MAG: FAD-binding oxidoreductase [Gammaproteobacteria bacterium]|nr:FAD-binding oxidoreductase [Gammaproteobacteria bacterium]